MATIIGTSGNDNGIDNPVLSGTDGADQIDGLTGDDVLNGLDGDDTLSPGQGVDTVSGGAGDDTVFLGTANNDGLDLDGGADRDRLVLLQRYDLRDSTLANFETLDMNFNNIVLSEDQFGMFDTINRAGQIEVYSPSTSVNPTFDLGVLTVTNSATATFRSLYSDAVTVTAAGSAQNWYIIGASVGAAHLTGGDGNDTLLANWGQDTLAGGAGNDVFQSSFSWDSDNPWTTIDGGTGRDVFVGSIDTEAASSSIFSTVFFEPTSFASSGDYSRFLFTDVEVLRYGGRFRAAELMEFSEFEDIGFLALATPGAVNFDGVSLNAIGASLGGGDRGTLNFMGTDSADSFTFTTANVHISMIMGQGNDTIYTGAHNDAIRSTGVYNPSWGMDDDVVYSGDSYDTVNAGYGDDYIDTGDTQADVRDVVEGHYGNDTILTGYGNDRVIAGPGDDYVNGEQGADHLDGGAGNDTLIGGEGEGDYGDRIFGGTGDDSIEGGAGGDDLYGMAGADTINGGTGADTIRGGADNDLITGGDDASDVSDLLLGEDGDDTIDGGYGNDRIYGDDGNDSLLGGFGSDTITGNLGNDTISGGALSDMIFGGDGDDFINGGFGYDRINLGAGADRVFHLGVLDHGSDWIQDFTEEDALVTVDTASASDFQVNFSNTAGAGDAAVDEAFVIYRPTGQILWALVDGADLTSLTLRIDEVAYDLLI